METPDLPQVKQHAKLEDWAERLTVALGQLSDMLREVTIPPDLSTSIADLEQADIDFAADLAALTAADVAIDLRLDALETPAAPTVPVGGLLPFAGTTAPTKYLKANGAAVLISSYPDLATAIYCGNAANPTAAWGYKATTNVSPSTNRSTSGTYLVLPDARGEFLRGWADDRAVDTGRSLWATQAEMVGPHSHNLRTDNTTTDNNNFPQQRGNSHQANFSTDNNSGTENRPRNIAALWCIRALP